MKEKLTILNLQWPLHVNSEENPAAANSAFSCYFPAIESSGSCSLKPCGWLLIKTLEAASSLTDRNAIQGQSRNTLSDLTYKIETKPSAMTFIPLLDGFRNSMQANWFIYSLIQRYRETGLFIFSIFRRSSHHPAEQGQTTGCWMV